MKMSIPKEAKSIEIEIGCDVEIKAVWQLPPKSVKERAAQNELNAKLKLFALKLEKRIADFVKRGLEKKNESNVLEEPSPFEFERMDEREDERNV